MMLKILLDFFEIFVSKILTLIYRCVNGRKVSCIVKQEPLYSVVVVRNLNCTEGSLVPSCVCANLQTLSGDNA